MAASVSNTLSTGTPSALARARSTSTYSCGVAARHKVWTPASSFDCATAPWNFCVTSASFAEPPSPRFWM